LSVPKVSSVILGVKNKTELEECLKAETMGKLSADQTVALDNLFYQQ
jgi:aryl-alcohol dehydrogenase-like predicted oxidoreductase